MILFNLSSLANANSLTMGDIPEKYRGVFGRIFGDIPERSEGEVTTQETDPPTHKKGFRLITSLKLEDVSQKWKHLGRLDIAEIAKNAHLQMSSELATLMGKKADVAPLAASLVNHITFTIQEGINDRLVDNQKTGVFLNMCGEWMEAEAAIQKWDLAKRSQMEAAVTDIVTRFSPEIAKQIKDKLMSYVKL